MHLIASYPGRSVAFSDVFCLVAPHGCPCPERFTRLLGAGRQMVAGAFLSVVFLAVVFLAVGFLAGAFFAVVFLARSCEGRWSQEPSFPQQWALPFPCILSHLIQAAVWHLATSFALWHRTAALVQNVSHDCLVQVDRWSQEPSFPQQSALISPPFIRTHLSQAAVWHFLTSFALWHRTDALVQNVSHVCLLQIRAAEAGSSTSSSGTTASTLSY